MPAAALACRPGCAACCIAPSISSAIPGMPQGKPAGVRCVQLDDTGRCQLFGRPERPAVCVSLQASADMCGASPAQALRWLERLEAVTQPAPRAGAGAAGSGLPGDGSGRDGPSKLLLAQRS